MVMLRRKMASLNANTSADTESELDQDEGFAEDIFNVVGDQVVFNVLLSSPDIAGQIDMPAYDEAGEAGAFARKATGQFAILSNEDATKVWDDIIDLYKATIKAMDSAGENPLKAGAEDLRAKVIESKTLVAGKGNTLFDGPAVLEKVSVAPTKKPPTWERAEELYRDAYKTINARINTWNSLSRQMEQQRVEQMRQRDVPEAQIELVRGSFDKTREAVRSAFNMMGQAFRGEDGSMALVYDIDLKSKSPGNFTRPSDHFAEVVKNKVRGTGSYALSQMAADKDGQTVIGKPVQGNKIDWEATSEKQTERYIVTGNLLLGYPEAIGIAGTSSPRITAYTTSDGQTKVGILMPVTFDPDVKIGGKGAKELAPSDAELIALFRDFIADSAQIQSEDPSAVPIASLARKPGGKVVVSILASKAGRFMWSHPSVKAQLPGLIQKGAYFKEEIQIDRLPAVLAAIRSAGNNFGAPKDGIKWWYDRIEAGFNKAIKATDPGGKAFDFVAGISYVLANSALKIAKQIYLATRDLTRAVRAAMAHLRMNVDDPAAADWSGAEAKIRAMLQSEGVDFVGDEMAPDAAAVGPEVESRGRFKGVIRTDSVAEWRRVADEWLAQFGRDLEAALAHAVSGATQLDAATRQFVLTRIIEMAETEIAASRNDVRTMAMLRVQAAAAAAAKDSGAIEFGKVGSARANALRSIDWLMPVLTFRDLVNKAQAKIPFPDVVSENIRAWLVQSGRKAIDEIRKAMADADNVVARELNAAARDLGATWREIFESSIDSQQGIRMELYKRIAAHPKLRSLSPASMIELSNLLATAWERERARIFRSEFDKYVKLPNVRPNTRAKLLRAIPRILRWSNIGTLDNQAFRNAVAPEFGVETFDGPLAKQIHKLAQDAQRVGGVNRAKILMQIYETMQKQGGIGWTDVARDYWYAAVLSGIRTQVDNGVNLLNGALNVGLAAARSPQAAPFIVTAWLNGLAEGAKDLAPILRGELFRGANFNLEQPTNTLEALGQSSNPAAKALSMGKFVSRVMVALDHMNNLSTQQAMLAWALYRADPRLAQAMIEPSPGDLALAEATAIAEGTPANLMDKRIREILQETLPVEALLSARDIGQMVAFQNRPYGLAGRLYQMIQYIDRHSVFFGVRPFKVLTGTQFLRYALNYTNEILNYVPPVALARYYASSPAMAGAPGSLDLSEETRDLILMKAGLGGVLAAVAAAVFLGDDDDERERAIDITGSFKSLDPRKRRQLLAEGRQPYSIRFGDTYISYRQMGFGGILGAIGELRDRQLFEPQKWSEESLAGKVADAAAAGMFIVRDSSALTGLTELVGVANAYKYSTDDLLEKSAPRWMARLAGSFIPNLAKEIDAWSDPSIFPAKTGHEFFVQQVPYLRRELGPGPILNVLGEPVSIERLPWSRWVKERKADKAWQTLGDLASRGVFMPSVGPVSTIDRKTGKRRPMTDVEQYAYQKKVGAEYRKFIERNSARLLKMQAEEARVFIDREADKIRERARKGS
jgi:hypothetical protein